MRKLVQKETDLAHLLEVRERREEESKREWADTLREEGFASDAALEAAIKKLEADLKKARKKEANEEDRENVGGLGISGIGFLNLLMRCSG